MTTWQKIVRFWKAFNCNHHNKLMHWVDGDGWNIVCCKSCGRAFMYTDGADSSESKSQAIKRVDCI